jgi:hypothetical protein
MSRWTRRGRQERARQRRQAPYVIVDDGRISGAPLIRLIRDCATGEVAHIIRALSSQLAGGIEQVANCRVDRAGFKLTNDLGGGVTMQRPC